MLNSKAAAAIQTPSFIIYAQRGAVYVKPIFIPPPPPKYGEVSQNKYTKIRRGEGVCFYRWVLFTFCRAFSPFFYQCSVAMRAGGRAPHIFPFPPFPTSQLEFDQRAEAKCSIPAAALAHQSPKRRL